MESKKLCMKTFTKLRRCMIGVHVHDIVRKIANYIYQHAFDNKQTVPTFVNDHLFKPSL